MTTPTYGYGSGRYAAVYDRLVAEAWRRGVCPKIVNGAHTLRRLHACGKPREPGSQWCREHQR